MITEEFAKHFAAEWVLSWNSRNMDQILSHYSEDFSIESPKALKLLPESKGIIRGKPAVRAYWTIAIEKTPDLEFEIIDVLTGLNALTIYYLNKATQRKSTESMFFNEEGKVNKAFVHHS